MNLWEHRAARNEALFREVNESIERLADDSGGASEAGFVCECSDDSCTELVHVSLSVYEHVRANPRHFLVRPGHERELDNVVERHPTYLIVAKEGDAGRISDRTDPRE
jgi:hypothetical protein